MKSPALKGFGTKSLIGIINHKFSGGESTKPLGEGWHLKKKENYEIQSTRIIKTRSRYHCTMG